MSINYSIFVKKPETTEKVKSALEKILNSELTPGKTGRVNFYGVHLLGLSINLIDGVTYGDDVIIFSEYGHEITVDRINGTFDRTYHQVWELMAATIIANMLSIELKCECIVAEGAQTVTERFDFHE